MVQVRDAQSGLGAEWLDVRYMVGAELTGLAEGVDGQLMEVRGPKSGLFKGVDMKMWSHKMDQLMISWGKYVQCVLKPSGMVYPGQRMNNSLAFG